MTGCPVPADRARDRVDFPDFNRFVCIARIPAKKIATHSKAFQPIVGREAISLAFKVQCSGLAGGRE